MEAMEAIAFFHSLTGRQLRTEENSPAESSGASRDLLRSEAFLRACGQRRNAHDGVFIATHDAANVRIGVMSNCQGPELARWLALATPASTLGVEVIGYDPAFREDFLRPFAGCDWILVAPFHSDQFRGLRAQELEADFPGRVLTIPSINFSGLQPDIVQLGTIRARLPAPIGSHSRLIVSGYLRGGGVEQTLSLFRDEVFAEFGLFDRWAIAEAELRQRDASCDVKVTDDLIELCRRQPAMLTENHPDGPVYVAVVKQLAALIGLAFSEPPCAMLPPIHSLSTVWPIYDSVAEHHELPYRTTQLYSTLDEVFTRKQLIERSFNTYDAIDREVLTAAARERSIPF
jgi:hypothetical protein